MLGVRNWRGIGYMPRYLDESLAVFCQRQVAGDELGMVSFTQSRGTSEDEGLCCILGKCPPEAHDVNTGSLVVAL